MYRNSFLWVAILVIALGNFLFATWAQDLFMPAIPYTAAIVVPWLVLSLVLCCSSSEASGLKFSFSVVRERWKVLGGFAILICAGLGLFLLLGFDRYFQAVRYPILFFVWIPIIEELLFRGWIFGKLKELAAHPIIVSSLLFSLHHLQYHHFHISLFVLFQLAYTFILGLILGKMRSASGSVYIGILLHVLINWLTLYTA